MADMETDQTDKIRSLGEKISVLGTTFAVHDEVELFNFYVKSLKQVCTLAYSRFSNQDQKTSGIWHEVLKILYFLGALCLHEGKPQLLSSLMRSSITMLPLDTIPRQWFSHLQRTRAKTIHNFYHLMFDVRSSIKAVEYQYRQFACDAETLTNSLFQCDLIHCLFLDTFSKDRYSQSLPFFGADYFDKITPLLEKLISDPDYRSVVFGNSLTDQCMATAVARYCLIVSNENSEFRSFWHMPLWDEGPPSIVQDFLRQNLTQEGYGSLMLR